MQEPELSGASPWEQRLYAELLRHVDDEMDILERYRAVADETDSPAFAYLARLILDDEQRHHLLLRDLAETIRISVEMTGEEPPIPDLAMFRSDRVRILEETEAFLALERKDNRELEALASDLRDVERETLWQLIVRLIHADNVKHRAILEFVRDRAREH